MHFHSPSPAAIVIAACATPEEAHAMTRWVRPLLDGWPRQSWAAWIADSRNCSAFSVALVRGERDALDWKKFDVSAFPADGQVCQLLGGMTGLVVLTHMTIAGEVVRHLEGLAARLICIDTADPIAKPFKLPFASFGVNAGL